jgi:DNA-binding CsgD family transcriptional regulator
MIKLLVYLLFILSVAFASAGIVLSIRLRNKHKSGYLSSLLYLQVFISAFGFYGIWGQIVIKTFLSDFVSPEVITRFSDISLLLGLPFIVFAWLMLLKFSLEISGHKTTSWFIFGFLIINFILIICLGYVISGNSLQVPVSLERYYYFILNFIYTISASAIILLFSKTRSLLSKNENTTIAFSITLFMILQAISLYFYSISELAGIAFIFIFFAGNSFLPVYLNYGVILIPETDKTVASESSYSLDDFCKKYDISPRESDIVREICNGHSNKEISEKLFISIQTVKDHTHRIYIKTNVRSRMQLMNLVKVIKT